jgi:tetrahydromethanopterin S-methyltransferase subunit G
VNEEIRLAELALSRHTLEANDETEALRASREAELSAIRSETAERITTLDSEASTRLTEEEKQLVEEERTARRILRQYDTIEERVQNATAAGRSQGVNIAKRNMTAKTQLVDAERETIRASLRERTETQTSLVEVAATRLEELEKRLESTRAAAVQLATQSVTSRSSAGALAEVSKIAMQQATSPSKK